MTSLALRLNGLQAGKRWLRCTTVSSFIPLSTWSHVPTKPRSLPPPSTSSLIPVKLAPSPCEEKYQVVTTHNYSNSEGSYDDSSGSYFGSQMLLLLSIFLGSAAAGVICAQCQSKREEEKEEFRYQRKRSEEMRYRDLDLEKASDLQDAIKKSQKLLRQTMQLAGAPGLVASVTVDGKTVWEEGFGFSDIENSVRCSPKTVMRIASISKPLTMTALAKLWEQDKVDLDAPIQKYVPYFPVKTFEGEEVTITTRHLISHKSGIRHYKRKEDKKANAKEGGHPSKDKDKVAKQKEGTSETPDKENVGEKKDNKSSEREVPGNDTGKTSRTSSGSSDEKSEKDQEGKCDAKSKKTGRKKKKKEEEEHEFDAKEYYIREKFKTIEDAVKLFQDDELYFRPGTGFLYTTHGWTVVSAVVEGAAGKSFTKVIHELFHGLGLKNTYLDDPTRIIFNRACYYVRDKQGKLQNAPYVDNSYKWAGGGFLSTVQDLTKFGNAMLYASQQDKVAPGNKDPFQQPGFLKSSTMRQLWTPVSGTNMGWDRDGGYGLGWGAVGKRGSFGYCHESRPYASHTGGAVGASSVLLVLPREEEDNTIKGKPPRGVVVALITNMSSVGLNKVALQIAELFENVGGES